MIDFFRKLVDTDFMPHGHCYFWIPEILWLHASSDILIALAYYSIPCTLVYFVRKRQDLQFPGIFLMFGVFIFACGTTHIVGMLTTWIPIYRIEGVIKLLTAGVSVVTAIGLIPLVPKALALPSPSQLELSNANLTRQITERRQAETRLAEAQRIAQLGSWEWDIVANTVQWSDQLYRIYGRQPGEFTATYEGFLEFVHPDDRDYTRQMIETAYRTGESFSFHHRIIHANGAVRTIHARGEVIVDQHGAPVRMTGTGQDITDSQAAQQELARQAAELKQLNETIAKEREQLLVTLRSIGDGVVATDDSGRVMRINRVMEVWSGWSREQVHGQPFDQVFQLINARTGQPVASPIAAAIERGQESGLAANTLLVSRDDRERFVACTGAPIRMDDGTISGSVLVFRDLSERRRLEMQVVQASRLQALGELAAGVAHELNQPLMGIRAFAERLLYRLDAEREISAETAEKSLVAIVEQVERMRGIIERLQGLARAPDQAGADQLALGKAVDNVLGLVGRQLREQDIEVNTDIPADLPLCRGRLHEIEQVLLNLVANARQALAARAAGAAGAAGAAHDPRLTLSAGVEGDRVWLRVADTGGGIPEVLLSRIFEPFFTTKEEGEGTGLGLSLSREIAQRYGGDLVVENRPGEGATIALMLPVIDEQGGER